MFSLRCTQLDVLYHFEGFNENESPESSIHENMTSEHLGGNVQGN